MSTLGSRQPQICSYYGAIKVVLFLVVEQYQTQLKCFYNHYGEQW